MAYEDIAVDVTIDNATKIIDYVGNAHEAAGAGYYTGIYFHRWLQDLADDQQAVTAGGDYMDMTKLTPSSRNGIDQIIEMLNGYTITQDMSEHLYDCSIIQAGGDDIWDGMTLIAGEGCDLQIQQDGAIVANSFWNSSPDGETGKGLNRDIANGIAARFLLKVTTAGTEIDGRKIIGQTRVWGFTYSEFKVNGTARGNNVIALNYSADNNNQTTQGTVQGWSGNFSNVPGYNAIDINADTTDEYYYSKWTITKPTRSINDAYEYWKEITGQANVTSFYGLDGEIFRGVTHEIDYSTLTGTIDHSESVTFSGGGVAQVLADDGSGTMWVQLLTGTAPIASETFTQSAPDAADATVDTVTERPLSFPFCGASTGSALLGGYGHGMITSEVTNNDKLTALDGVQRTPPNNQNFYVNGLVVGEDYVLVGPQNAGQDDIEYGQFAISTALAGSDANVILKLGLETPGTGTASELDTPATGTIRVLGNDGILHMVAYTGYTVQASTITFTGCSDAPVADVDNDACISYIDTLAGATTESYLATFDSTRTLFGRVRDGKSTPIKTFEAKNATFGSAGGSISVSRASDE